MARSKAVRWDAMSKEHTPLERLIPQYEAFNRSEGKTLQTVRWYNAGLRLFQEYLRQQGLPPTLASVEVETVCQHVLYLQRRKKFDGHPSNPPREELLSPQSITCYIRATKAFASWLHEEGYTPGNRLQRLKAPKAPKKLAEPLTQPEVAAILSSIDPHTAWGARNVAVVLLLLDTGLRLSEVLTLPMRDLHLEEGSLKVMGKGQKERIVPFGGAAQKALMKYLYHFRPEPLGEDRVFLNLDGAPMAEDGLRVVFRRLAKASGVARLHPHLLRHTFAVNYLMNGGDVFTLQQILGHTTLEMVRHYVNLANAHVLTQHKRFSPVDRMNLRQVTRAVALRDSRGGGRRMTKAGRA